MRQPRVAPPNQNDKLYSQPRMTNQKQFFRNFNQNQITKPQNPFHRNSEPMDTSPGTIIRQPYKTERMDIDSGHTNMRSNMTRNTHQTSRTQQSGHSRSNTREIYNINSQNNSEDRNPANNEELFNIEDSQNFRTSAWLSQQGT